MIITASEMIRDTLPNERVSKYVFEVFDQLIHDYWDLDQLRSRFTWKQAEDMLHEQANGLRGYVFITDSECDIIFNFLNRAIHSPEDLEKRLSTMFRIYAAVGGWKASCDRDKMFSGPIRFEFSAV